VRDGTELEAWTDVVGFDGAQPAVWDAVQAALVYWLEALRPVFLLAEWEARELHERAFDMTYDWGTWDLQGAIVRGTKTAADRAAHLVADRAPLPPDALRMVFTTLHDGEHRGPAFEAFEAPAFLLPGRPLIDSGQGAVLDRRLAFFEKDPIDGNTFARTTFDRGLTALKRDHPALAGGLAGGPAEYLAAEASGLFVVRRQKGGDSVTGVFNLSGRALTSGPVGPWAGGHLEAWAWKILTS